MVVAVPLDIPPGPKIGIEDELPLNKEDKGDARFCSAV